MSQRARDVYSYTKNGMRQCDLKIGPRLSRFSSEPVRRKAVDNLRAQRQALYFEGLRFQMSNAWSAVLFLQDGLQLSTAEIARVFHTSERKVLIWFYLGDTARGQHVAMCNAVKDLSELAIMMHRRRAAGRIRWDGATIREWFDTPNPHLRTRTPLEALYTQEFRMVSSAMYEAVRDQ
jgi:hypothetical protein